MAYPTPISRASLVDDVAEQLRTLILNGDLKPGERLRMNGLEQRFAVSHIPIREALRRLESERLVIALPRHVAVVAGVDLQDLESLYDVRRMIEVPTIRRATAQRTPESVENAWLALEALERSASDLRDAAFWRNHQAFHWALLEVASSVWIRRTLEQLWAAAERYVRLFVADTVSPAMDDHRRFVQLLEAGDVDEMETLLLRHLKRTEMAVTRALPRASVDGTATPRATGAPKDEAEDEEENEGATS